MMQRFSASVVVAIAVLVSAACGGGGATGSGSNVTFAAPVSQTGAFGQAEGLYTLQGYKFCVQTLNSKGGISFGGQSHKVNLVTEDDQSVAATSAQIVAEQGVTEAKAKGITVVPSATAYTSSTKVTANATDVSSALIAIKGTHPDVIII